VFFYVTLEPTESGIAVVKEDHVLAIDCAVFIHSCIQCRDNTSSMPRWLGVVEESGQVYSYLETLPVQCIPVLPRVALSVCLTHADTD